MGDGGAWMVVDGANVLSEVIDDEVMIIDMRVGNYYSLRGVGMTIWNALRQARRPADIVGIVCRDHTETPEDVSAQVQRFIDELVSEQLVGRLTEPPNGSDAAAAPSPPGARQSFSTPRLEKYTDMQTLLLVDPIHDVDELGWPNRAKPT